MNPSRKCAARPAGPYGIDAKRKCTQPVHRATAALCKAHEKQWRIVSKARSAARREAAAQEAAAAEQTVSVDVSAPEDNSLSARNARALKATRA